MIGAPTFNSKLYDEYPVFWKDYLLQGKLETMYIWMSLMEHGLEILYDEAIYTMIEPAALVHLLVTAYEVHLDVLGLFLI